MPCKATKKVRLMDELGEQKTTTRSNTGKDKSMNDTFNDLRNRINLDTEGYREEVSLYCGDCMDAFKVMSNNSVDLTLTDVPYDALNSMSGTKREEYKGALRKHSKGAADVITFDLGEFIDHLCRITSQSCYVFCSTEQVSFIRKKFIDNGLSTRLCVWEKTNPAPSNGQYLWLSGVETCVFARKPNATFNEHCKNTVWRFPNARSKIHPTEKPLDLFKYLVKTSSNEGDLVMDCCMGSGTSGVAALTQNRDFLGIEIKDTYFADAELRILGALMNRDYKGKTK